MSTSSSSAGRRFGTNGAGEIVPRAQVLAQGWEQESANSVSRIADDAGNRAGCCVRPSRLEASTTVE